MKRRDKGLFITCHRIKMTAAYDQPPPAHLFNKVKVFRGGPIVLPKPPEIRWYEKTDVSHAAPFHDRENLIPCI